MPGNTQRHSKPDLGVSKLEIASLSELIYANIIYTSLAKC